jgi:DNA-binding response OmpR family regulator
MGMLKDIVIVTKNDTIRALYDRAFHSRGIRAHLFPSLEDARAHTRTSHPDAVVVDLESPSRAELKICRKLKAGLPKVPMLLLGHEERTDNLTLQTGADGYLRKPFTPDHLMARVDELKRELIERDAEAKAKKAAFEDVARDPRTRLLNEEVFEAEADEIEHKVMNALSVLSLASFAVRIDRFKELAAQILGVSLRKCGIGNERDRIFGCDRSELREWFQQLAGSPWCRRIRSATLEI